jgi:hypothetical protein
MTRSIACVTGKSNEHSTRPIAPANATKYVKVAFFRGTSLRPVPPGASKDKYTRYLDIHEDDPLDVAQTATWIRQAAALPGWVP